MEKFSFFQLLSLISTALAVPSVKMGEISTRDNTFYMASIGDSWAAGAALPFSSDLYDGDNGCLRSKKAWEALMVSDPNSVSSRSWTDGPIDFKFVACSGARLRSAVLGDPDISQPKPQLDFVGTPHLLTMELGGNDCHFAEIARTCIFVGELLTEYPDPASACTKLLTDWGNYINSDSNIAGESFYFDHHATLKDIMNSETIKGRDDFYFYIVGYAEFFNTSPGSDWCNDQSFGKIFHPKLSNGLRSKINELVAAVNSKIAQSVQDMGNKNIKFLDVSPLYENHRFCEPGHTFDDQYYSKDVWIWNLSPPETDPGFTNDLASQAKWQAQWIANSKLPNGKVATPDDIQTMLGGKSSSSGRVFHPKIGGYASMKSAMITMLQNDKVPGVKPPHPKLL